VIADLRAAVYGNVASCGGRKDFETMLTVIAIKHENVSLKAV